jgi:hypothetical protein
MPKRIIEVNGDRWEAFPSGRVTQYGRDEFGVIFSRTSASPVERRVARYAPLGARNPEASFGELSDSQLRDLWSHSQPGWTAPETGYRT